MVKFRRTIQKIKKKKSSLFRLKLYIPQEIFDMIIFNMIEFQKCLHELSSRWSTPGVKHYKKKNFVSVSFDAIMMKRGQLIDFDKRKNLQ